MVHKSNALNDIFVLCYSMTFWSRYDPIRQPKGNTDHWSKCRQRVSKYNLSNVCKCLYIRVKIDTKRKLYYLMHNMA